jgi:hypothetical protein
MLTNHLQLPEFGQIHESLRMDGVQRVSLEVKLHKMAAPLKETRVVDACDVILAQKPEKGQYLLTVYKK